MASAGSRWDRPAEEVQLSESLILAYMILSSVALVLFRLGFGSSWLNGVPKRQRAQLEAQETARSASNGMAND